MFYTKQIKELMKAQMDMKKFKDLDLLKFRGFNVEDLDIISNAFNVRGFVEHTQELWEANVWGNKTQQQKGIKFIKSLQKYKFTCTFYFQFNTMIVSVEYYGHLFPDIYLCVNNDYDWKIEKI